jgi:hypothetical protein
LCTALLVVAASLKTRSVCISATASPTCSHSYNVKPTCTSLLAAAAAAAAAAAVDATDTPGVHLHHRIPHMLTPAELRLLHPRKRLMAFSPPSPLDILREQEDDNDDGDAQLEDSFTSSSSSSSGPNAGSSSDKPKPKTATASYIWSGLVRVDVLSGPPSCSLAFYGPRTMRVYALPLLAEGQEVDFEVEDEDEEEEVDAFLQELLDEQQGEVVDPSSSSSSSKKGSKGSTVLFCKESVQARGGLVPHSFVVKSPIPTAACLADVAVSGLPGWVGVYAPFSKQDIVLRVWVPRGVEVFLRPPLPCPVPPKPRGSDEPEELVEVGQTLAAAEADQEWEAYKSGLGLKPLSGEDEEVVRLLLFGSEADGVQGIVDVEEDGWEDEGEVEQQDDADDEEVDAGEVLVAPPVVRAENVFAGSSSSSSRGRRRSSGGAGEVRQRRSRVSAAAVDYDTVVEVQGVDVDVGADSAVAADSSADAAGLGRRRRRIVSKR